MSAGMTALGKSQLIAAMAAAISTSSITDRPILSLDDEGDICIDLAKLSDALITAGYGKLATHDIGS